MPARTEKALQDLTFDPKLGWHCAAGSFRLDSTTPSLRGIVSHAHMDHYSRNLSGEIHATPETLALIRARASRSVRSGADPFRAMPHPYDEAFELGGAKVTFLPSGHMLGSCQVQIETADYAALYSGDLMMEANPSCEAWRLPTKRPDLLVMESTFGQTARHPKPEEEILRALGGLRMPAMIGVYAAGKAQRLNALLSALLPDLPVMVDPEIAQVHRVYETFGRNVGTYSNYQKKVARKLGQPYVRLVTVGTLVAHQRDDQYLKFLASGWDRRASNRWLTDDLRISDHVSSEEIMEYVEKVNPHHVAFWHGDSTSLVAACLSKGISASAC